MVYLSDASTKFGARARSDEQASVLDITADLERSFSTEGLRGDVEDFLRHAYEQHWIV